MDQLKGWDTLDEPAKAEKIKELRAFLKENWIDAILERDTNMEQKCLIISNWIQDNDPYRMRIDD